MTCASYGVGGKFFTTNFDGMSDHELLLGGCSPTDGTNTPQGGAAVSAAPTKLLLTPQNARNTRNLLLRETSTDGTDWHRCLGAFKGVHLSQVHQPSKKCTNRAKSIFSHRFHSAQMLGCAEFNHGLNGYDGA